MFKKFEQMQQIREQNRVYFNKNHSGSVQCEYCFELLESFDEYRYGHVKKCSAKRVFKKWIKILDLEVELYGDYQPEPFGTSQRAVVYGHCAGTSDIDSDGDDGMNEQGLKQVLIQTGKKPGTGGDFKHNDEETLFLDLSADELDPLDPLESNVLHEEHVMMEKAMYQNMRDNTEEGRKRMAAKAKRRSKRAMDSDTDEDDEKDNDNDDDNDNDREQKRLDAKVLQFKNSIVDFSAVPGMDLAVKQFIIMS